VHFELELNQAVTTYLILDIFVTHRKGHQSASYWGRAPLLLFPAVYADGTDHFSKIFTVLN